MYKGSQVSELNKIDAIAQNLGLCVEIRSGSVATLDKSLSFSYVSIWRSCAMHIIIGLVLVALVIWAAVWLLDRVSELLGEVRKAIKYLFETLDADVREKRRIQRRKDDVERRNQELEEIKIRAKNRVTELKLHKYVLDAVDLVGLVRRNDIKTIKVQSSALIVGRTEKRVIQMGFHEGSFDCQNLSYDGQTCQICTLKQSYSVPDGSLNYLLVQVRVDEQCSISLAYFNGDSCRLASVEEFNSGRSLTKALKAISVAQQKLSLTINADASEERWKQEKTRYEGKYRF